MVNNANSQNNNAVMESMGVIERAQIMLIQEK